SEFSSQRMFTMKVILAVLALVGIAQSASSLRDLSMQKAEFQSFQLVHNKNYKDAAELLKRSKIFEDNKKVIDAHNARYAAGLETYQMSVNQFTDLLPSEFKEYILSKMDPSELTAGIDYRFSPSARANIPSSIDWRAKGAVTPVKNQGNCGSCWAFSSIGTLEGRHFLATQQLVALSEQNLVDCSTENGGCDGGWPATALQFIKNNGGVDTEASYPYEAVQGVCRFNPSNVGATVSNVVWVAGNEAALKVAVAEKGPISVAIDSSLLQHYSSGVFNEPSCSSEVDHGVLVVGYGSDAVGGDYWIVKNSWGTSWGEDGYALMARNRNNQCAIASYGVYPLV
ncbi:hypothetical protein KR222_004672, partial [Zaprionus bogoriensis]